MTDKLRATLLLIFSLVLLGVGGWFTYAGDRPVIASACNRSGLILFAVWLAMPQLKQLRWTGSTSFIVGAIICAITLAIRPKAMLFVGPILLVMGAMQFIRWLFAPMPKK